MANEIALAGIMTPLRHALGTARRAGCTALQSLRDCLPEGGFALGTARRVEGALQSLRDCLPEGGFALGAARRAQAMAGSQRSSAGSSAAPATAWAT